MKYVYSTIIVKLKSHQQALFLKKKNVYNFPIK